MPFHLRNKRWSCIVAHRRAGKTVACVNDLITRALASPKENPRYRYIAPYYNQAKAVAWDYLKQYSAALQPKVNESELSVEFRNAHGKLARIRLFGADNLDALRGQYSDGDILDEFADFRPRAWGEVIRPSLADRKGWAVFIGTPKGHNEFYRIHQLAQRETDWFHMVLRASESGLLSPVELKSMRDTMTEDQAEQELECSFEAAIIGAVYGRQLSGIEKAGRITSVDIDPQLPVHTAWDLGLSDATAIWFFQVLYNEVRIIDYVEGHHERIEDYVDLLKAKAYRYGKHWLPHDGNNKLLAAGGRSIVQQLFELGVKAFVVPATTHVNQIASARKVLEKCWFDRERCHEGIEALKQYQFEFDEDKKAFKERPRHDWTSHAADAFEILSQVVQNPKELEPREEPKFLHQMTANDVFWPPKSAKSVKIERI
jgi:hypothetical protein